jgi:undecaprenyl diphosphate synthase
MGARMNTVPKHVGLIMDGNRTWASGRGLETTEGYRAGCRAIAELVREAARQGIEALTLYTFSVDNWKRPQHEIDAIFASLIDLLALEAKAFAEEGIAVCAIGATRQLPSALQESFANAEAMAPGAPRLRVAFALNYGGREDIFSAVQQLMRAVERGERSLDTLTARDLEALLATRMLPPLDLIIRTAGQHRLSDFLLWEAAYAELLFVDTLWPDFDAPAFAECIRKFGKRNRNFGK